MFISEKKSAQLRAFFSSFTETQRETLIMSVKAAKVDGGVNLPCDDLLALLEDDEAIAEQRWRELFTAAQPLMVDVTKRSDHIDVALAENVWEFFLRKLNPQTAATWLAGQMSLADIRNSICSTYTELLETETGLQSLAERFEAAHIAQLRVLLSFLACSDDLEGFFAGWPAQVKDLSDELLFPLRDFNEYLIAEHPEITPYLLFLVATHLEKPFQIFRAVEKITGHSNDRVMVKTELKAVGDALLERNDEYLNAFDWEKGQAANVTNMVSSLSGFVKLTSGWMSEFEIDPSGPWGKRLASQRSLCGKVWGKHMNRIRKAVDRALPRKKGNMTGRQTMPDLKSEIDEARIVLLENEICLLLEAGQFSSRAGFQAEKDKAAQLVEIRLEEQSNDLLDLLGDNSSEDYQQIIAHFAVLVRITKAYLGAEDAKVLQRRSAAAMAA